MEIATKPPTILDATDTQTSPSTTFTKYTISSYCINLKDDRIPRYIRDTRITNKIREKIYAGPISTQSDVLTRLPLEIIYRVLNCMRPEEYAGLAYTSRLALMLTNIQVQVQQSSLVWRYFDSITPAISFSQHISLANACRALRKTERQMFQAMAPKSNSTTSSETPDTQKPPERKIEEMMISGYLVNLRTDPSPDTREQIDAGPVSPTPNFLTTLPLEIVYNILSCLFPSEYAGLACTCRYALKLTNTYLESETEKCPGTVVSGFYLMTSVMLIFPGILAQQLLVWCWMRLNATLGIYLKLMGISLYQMRMNPISKMSFPSSCWYGV